MRSRMRCLWHCEDTPSLVRRKLDWYCYGACNKAYSHQEVEERLGKPIEYIYDESEDYQEDLQTKFEYISTLKQISLRGLRFPADERGYYIVWGDHSYYKYRLFEPGKGGKYLSPKGHKPGLFWASKKGKDTLALVEGEINSLSVTQAMPEWDVCSPGSATMFNSDFLSRYLTEFKQYSNITVILDKDAAGMKALIESKAYFLYKLPFIRFIQLETDCNEILVEKGKVGLRQELSGSGFK